MLVQDPDASHTNPYACPGSQRFTRKTLLRGNLPTMPTIPDASHAKSLCLYRFLTIQIIAYAGAALRQLRHFLMQVQVPNTSHANPYACAGSQQFKQLLTPGYASNNSHANPYSCTGSRCFTCTSLCLYRFPMLHMHILTLVQVPDSSDHSLRLGSLPTIPKIPYMTNINSV
ncbi:hypothetical protein O181_024767 [Austropuccinia psidii MF-1]|uniref:Uncharacterized protein n=1 Tax=Austropuccinia psidii MF-1 TaxID=1389203 RepID=A0A9Q3GZ95_9BASI|nr:hypothetical protein [Austropuccinia psidii MF-1]